MAGTPFKMIARSVGYRLGKTHASGVWRGRPESGVDFDALFQPAYAEAARQGFLEGLMFMELKQQGRYQDTFHKGGKA